MAYRRSGILLACLVGIVLLSFSSAFSQTDGRAVGKRRYVQLCAGCHGSEGKGGDKAISLVTNQHVIDQPDAELFRIVRDGTTEGMPPFAQIGDSSIAAVIQYLRVLQHNSAENEANHISDEVFGRGRSLFFGKGECGSCHMILGKGGFIASNLATYARNRRAEAIRQAIITPDNPLIPSSRVVTVTMKSGQKITAVLRNEDNFSMELQTQDGYYQFLARSDVDDVQYSDHSLMPRDYGVRLSTKEINNIVSFLTAVSRNPQDAGQSK